MFQTLDEAKQINLRLVFWQKLSLSVWRVTELCVEVIQGLVGEYTNIMTMMMHTRPGFLIQTNKQMKKKKNKDTNKTLQECKIALTSQIWTLYLVLLVVDGQWSMVNGQDS